MYPDLLKFQGILKAIKFSDEEKKRFYRLYERNISKRKCEFIKYIKSFHLF